MIVILIGHATAADVKAARHLVADRIDIDVSLAITTSVTPVMRPRGKVLIFDGFKIRVGSWKMFLSTT